MKNIIAATTLGKVDSSNKNSILTFQEKSN